MVAPLSIERGPLPTAYAVVASAKGHVARGAPQQGVERPCRPTVTGGIGTCTRIWGLRVATQGRLRSLLQRHAESRQSRRRRIAKRSIPPPTCGQVSPASIVRWMLPAAPTANPFVLSNMATPNNSFGPDTDVHVAPPSSVLSAMPARRARRILIIHNAHSICMRRVTHVNRAKVHKHGRKETRQREGLSTWRRRPLYRERSDHLPRPFPYLHRRKIPTAGSPRYRWFEVSTSHHRQRSLELRHPRLQPSRYWHRRRRHRIAPRPWPLACATHVTPPSTDRRIVPGPADHGFRSMPRRSRRSTAIRLYRSPEDSM